MKRYKEINLYSCLPDEVTLKIKYCGTNMLFNLEDCEKDAKILHDFLFYNI